MIQVRVVLPRYIGSEHYDKVYVRRKPEVGRPFAARYPDGEQVILVNTAMQTWKGKQYYMCIEKGEYDAFKAAQKTKD